MVEFAFAKGLQCNLKSTEQRSKSMPAIRIGLKNRGERENNRKHTRTEEQAERNPVPSDLHTHVPLLLKREEMLHLMARLPQLLL